MTKTMLNVALLGMNDKNQSTFTYFIRKHAGQFLQLTSPVEADVFIIDFDTEDGIMQWHEHCGHCQKPSITLSAVNPEKPCSIWVAKPVTSRNLEQAVSQLIKLARTPAAVPVQPAAMAAVAPAVAAKAVEPRLQVVADNPGLAEKARHKPGYARQFSDDSSPNLTLSREEIVECCGSQLDADPQTAGFRALVSYDETRTLLAPLQQAIELARDKATAVEIQGLRTPLVVMPGGERIMIDLGNHMIRHMCAMPMQAMPAVRPLLLSAMETERRYPAHHPHMHSAAAVVWQIALWTSRGRLPKSLNPTQKVRMACWPNFTRLLITPHAIQIASLWVGNDLSPVEIANTISVPQRYVFALTAAVQAGDGFVAVTADAARPVENSWKKPQEFFSTILRSLKIA